MNKKRLYSDQDFKRLIEGNYYYVDKTKVIEDLILNKGDGTALFPRPRRFGKSLFMSMLDNYFNVELDSKHLFKGLYIEKSKVFKENLNKYPLIHLDFKCLKADNYDSFYYSFKSMMSKVYECKEYIKNDLSTINKKIFNNIINRKGSIEEYKDALYNLTVWLNKYYAKEVIVLIDEYDAPIDASYNNRYYEKLMNLFRPVFESTFKGNSNLKLGIMTGVLRIGGESFFSSFNNPKIYDVMSTEYSDYFGFTKSETKELLEYYDLKLTKEVSDYYDGYNFNGTHVYNPWSITSYASEKRLRPYWINTGSNTLIKNLLSGISSEDKVIIEKLLLGISVPFKYQPKFSYNDLKSDNMEAILNLMLISGYLTYSYVDEYGENYFKVPNNEVREDLYNIIRNITLNTSTAIMEAKEFIKSLERDDKVSAEVHLNNVLTSVSYRDNKEAFYHGYVLSLFDLLIGSSDYLVYSNRESGYGIPDVIVKNKKKSLGILVEFKVSKKVKDMESDAKVGKKQIKDNKYREELEKDKINTIYETVVVFHGKQAIVR